MTDSVVHIVCPSPPGRVLTRMSHALARAHGWTVSGTPVATAAINLFMPYIHAVHKRRWEYTPSAAWFTHREDTRSIKVKWWQQAVDVVDLPLVTTRLWDDDFRTPPTLVRPYVGRQFELYERPSDRVTLGFSGFATGSVGKRKGVTLAQRLHQETDYTFVSSGRGWPGPCQEREWRALPWFYSMIDVLVCTSLIEGVPMPVLEMLATGGQVVIPEGVGLLDTLPDVDGIHRYKRGDYPTLLHAVERAEDMQPYVDRRALREVVLDNYTEENWTGDVLDAVASFLFNTPSPTPLPAAEQAGVFMVAFGDKAKAQSREACESIRQHTNMPVCIVSDEALSWADIPVVRPDKDIGGRTWKLRPWHCVPEGWSYVLYLDADTRLIGDPDGIIAPLRHGADAVFFRIWEPFDMIRGHIRPHTKTQYHAMIAEVGSGRVLQPHGGIWALRRSAHTEAFMEAWYNEWRIHATRDQPALLRTLFGQPMTVVWLDPMTHSLRGGGSDVVIHLPGEARRFHNYPAHRWDDMAHYFPKEEQ